MRLSVRLAALTLVGSVLSAAGPEAWVPIRWNGGPLEVARRAQSGHPADTERAKVLNSWYNPRTLDLLQNTAINCILVTWSAGANPVIEGEQRKQLTEYVRAAHERRIAVLGSIYPGADAGSLVASAIQAGLDGLVVESGFSDGPRISREVATLLREKSSAAVVIPLGSRDWLSSEADWTVLGTSDGVAARIPVTSESGAVMASTTSEPWIASNTWLVRSLRAPVPLRPIWLGHRLDNPAEHDYERAIADAAAGGGRWIVALDDALLAGLWRAEPAALAAWRRIASCLGFYEDHADWNAFVPAAALGIIQDRHASEAETATEYLNLTTRRRIPYRVIERADLTAAVLDGLPAVLAAALVPPTPKERKLLTDFAEKGGLVVGGPAWRSDAGPKTEYVERKLGAGRVAAYPEEWPDPEAVARDLLDLIGDDNLPVRLFNVASVLGHVTTDQSHSRLLVQLVNYATLPSENITVRARGTFTRARLYSPEGPVSELKITRSGNTTEVRLHDVTVSAGLLFEK